MILIVECRVHGKISKTEKEKLLNLSKKLRATPILAYWNSNYKKPFAKNLLLEENKFEEFVEGFSNEIEEIEKTI